MRCTVKWFDAKKGYGIISTKGGKEDYFVHQSNIVMDGFRYLCEGDIVDFDVIPGEDGRTCSKCCACAYNGDGKRFSASRKSVCKSSKS